MTDFRMIDRPTAPQEVTIQFVRNQRPDAHPDVSYLQQDYADVTDETEREKCLKHDRERLAAYEGGEWDMRGFWVEARISVPVGGGSFAVYELSSPGLWGVESDSDDEYKEQIWRDQEEELRSHLRTMGEALAKLERARVIDQKQEPNHKLIGGSANVHE